MLLVCCGHNSRTKRLHRRCERTICGCLYWQSYNGCLYWQGYNGCLYWQSYNGCLYWQSYRTIMSVCNGWTSPSRWWLFGRGACAYIPSKQSRLWWHTTNMQEKIDHWYSLKIVNLVSWVYRSSLKMRLLIWSVEPRYKLFLSQRNGFYGFYLSLRKMCRQTDKPIPTYTIVLYVAMFINRSVYFSRLY